MRGARRKSEEGLFAWEKVSVDSLYVHEALGRYDRYGIGRVRIEQITDRQIKNS